MDVRMPDGTIIRNVPDGVTRDEVMARWRQMKAPPSMNVDPTEGMSTGERLLAGIGMGMTNVGRGLGQMVGLVDRADVEEARKRDAALSATGAGRAGDILGTTVMLLPTAFIPGAATMKGATAIGALTGLAAPSASTEETIKNAAIGGVAAPVAIGAGRALGAAYRGAQGLAEPFTRRGQERIAAATLRQFAGDPARAAQNMRAAQALVPDSGPTMAQAADDSGIAQLERLLRNNPEAGPVIDSQLRAQRTARLAAVQNVAGDDAYYNAIKEGRQVFANEDYARAFAQGFDLDALQKAEPALQKIMSRPVVQAAKKTAIELAKNNDDEIADIGSVKGLDYMMKALDNQIDKASSVGSSVGKEQLRALVKAKTDLMDVVEQVAPAYKEARSNFADMSRQVNAMDVGRDVLKKMQSPLARFGADTRELKNEYARALESATSSIKKQTGQNLPLSAVMPQRDLSTLENVARDMARAANADDLGRAVGSNTAQNLSAQNLMRRVLGPTGLPDTWSESNMLQSLLAPYTGLARVGGSERAVIDRLARAAIDPQDAAGLLMMSQRPDIAGLLGVQSLRYAPAVSAGLLGYSP